MPRPRIAVPDLLEREHELAAIRALLDRGTGALLLEGPAGIGKTRLLDAACEAASPEPPVARARGGEFERDLAYGVVRQLFAPLVERLPTAERDQVLAGPRALARRALDPAGEPADPGPVREAVTHLALSLAGRRRLLIVVDDLHWADEASLLWMLHLVRRIDGAPVAVVAARRTDEPGQSRALDAIAAEAGVERVEPAPLTPEGVARLLRQARPEDAAPEAGRWHELTGGNPFLLHELLTAGEADRGAPAPAGVVESVRRRLARLPADAAGFARALSVLERAAKIDDAARLAGITEAGPAVDALVACGLVTHRAELEFVHPLVRRAIYDDLAPGERSVQHERAARLLAQRGDVEQAAAHLLLSGRAPDAEAIDVLRGAARLANARGAPDLAARALRSALTGRELGTRRAALLGELGLAELRALDPAGFEHLHEGIGASDDVREAARLAVPTARALTVLWRHREAVDLLEPVLARLPADEVHLRRALEGELLATGSADTQTLPIARQRLVETLAREGSNPVDDPVAWGIRAMASAAAGVEREESARIARLAIDGGRFGDGFASGLPYPSMALLWAGEVGAAQSAWEAALDRANRAGSALEAALARCYLAVCANARGEFTRAERHAGTALNALIEAGVPAGPNPLAPLADALIARGAAGDALSMFEKHLDPRTATSVSFPLVLFSRGRARIAMGDGGGVDEVLEAGRRLVAQGAMNPAVAPWRSVAGVALAARGEAGRARDLVHEELAAASAFGAPIGVGAALAGTAAVSIAESEPHRALENAREAVRTLEPTAARGALADGLACEGRALAAVGKRVEARRPLRLALDLAHRLGAAPLAERVRAELVATGARPRRAALSGPAALTPRERRVAKLAAEGRSSREIADQLVVSVRTVDLHLNSVYRKLGIDGRADLARALAPQKASVEASKDW
jgi:DNA-binding CsgD family transcriptional regulator